MKQNTDQVKKPWLAAVLNIIPGLGYLYLRKRKVFSYLLLSALLFEIAACFDPEIYELMTPSEPIFIFLMILSGIFYAAAFMYDAYAMAKKLP